MGANSRVKGMRGEREVARIWEAAGFEVRTMQHTQGTGNAPGDHVVICGNGVTIHSEVKRAERLKLPEWLRQAYGEAPPGTIPIVSFRRSREDWYAALKLVELATLLGVYTE